MIEAQQSRVQLEELADACRRFRRLLSSSDFGGLSIGLCIAAGDAPGGVNICKFEEFWKMRLIHGR